jgi:fructokinase
MSRFVVCGETLIDLVRGAEPTDDHFRTTWQALSAGGPMNTAVALGRLGADSHFLGRMSRDAFGRQLHDHLTTAGVELDLVVTTDQATSLAVVELDDDGVASYTFHFADTANFGWRPEELPELAPDDWLHIASLSCVVAPGAEVLRAWAGRSRSPLSYDINVRPTVITDPAVYWKEVEPWLELTGRSGGIVKASDADLAALPPGRDRDPVELAEEWRERYGLRAMIVTLGPDGAVGLDADGRTTVPGRAVEVVDTVGAGDTFMAGFLDGLIRREDDLAESLRRGVAAAAIVCGRQGAQPPTAAEVDALLRS